MNVSEVISDYQSLRAGLSDLKLPPIETGVYQLEVTNSVEVTTPMLKSEQKILEKLADLNPCSGWLGFQSGNQYFNEHKLIIHKDYGSLLNAEVSIPGQDGDNNRSLHVRYNGAGGWFVTEYEFGPQVGGEYLADRVRHTSTIEKPGTAEDKQEFFTLNYVRFWKVVNGMPGVNPVYACFNGIGA